MPQYYKLIEEVTDNEVAQHVKRMLENSGISENRASFAQILLFANYGGFRSEFNEATLSQLDMLKDAEALLVKAINAAQDGRAQEVLNEGNEYSFADLSFSLSDSLDGDLEMILGGSFPADKTEVYIGKGSSFLHNLLGVEVLSQTMPPNKAYAAMVSEEKAKEDNRYNEKLHYHNLGKSKLIKAIEESERPIVAIVSRDDPDTGKRRNDTIALITDEVDDNGDYIVVYERLQDRGTVYGKRNTVNKIPTVFGRDALDKYIKDAIDTNRILYVDKKRSHLVVGGTEQSALSRRNYDFTDNIQQFVENFNYMKGKTYIPESKSGGVSMADAFKNAKPLKSKFSIDSNGNELSSQQSEYFKDSKVRDENVNHMVTYQGTHSADLLKQQTKNTNYLKTAQMCRIYGNLR